MENKRRSLLKLTGLAGFGFLGTGLSLPGFGATVKNIEHATPEAIPPVDLAPLNRFPTMVQEYFVDHLKKIEQAGEKRRAALKTKADAEAYIRDVRKKIAKAFGVMPDKTPLNARVAGKLEKDAYTIEKVIFDSRPNFPVTANLYIPKGKNFPLPAVVGVCGHGAAGKSYPTYQSFAQGLALKGYVVLIFDPIGQGERTQLSKALQSKYKPGTSEHIFKGNQLFLTGGSLSSWFAWDGIRAVDYLLTRKEVDPKHIGLTGNSGGGTQTTWVSALDDRITMAAPGCFITTFRRNLENENAADTEQCPPDVLAYGLDHSDFIAAMAPKPVILLSQEKDFFDARGVEEAYLRLKKIYKLLGAEENIQLFVGKDYHGYSQPNREAMYGFFNKVTGNHSISAEPLSMLEPDEALWCTTTGQVADANPENIFSISSVAAGKQKLKRKTPGGEALKKAVADALKLPVMQGVPDYRILRPENNRDYPRKFAATYALETEPDLSIIVYRLDDNALYSRPPKGIKRAILYVSHLSADEELRRDAFVRNIIGEEPEAAIFAMDVRGVGETKPNSCGNSFGQPYGSDYFYAIHSLMLGRPYVGQKTHDVLTVINWLKANGHDEVHVVAKGWGALPATFAAVLSDTVKDISLKNALTSYADIAESEDYNWPLSAFIPDVIRKFDLPDCYATLSVKNIKQVAPSDAKAEALMTV